MELVNKPFTMGEYELERKNKNKKEYYTRLNLAKMYRPHSRDYAYDRVLELAENLFKELYGNNNS